MKSIPRDQGSPSILGGKMSGIGAPSFKNLNQGVPKARKERSSRGKALASFLKKA